MTRTSTWFMSIAGLLAACTGAIVDPDRGDPGDGTGSEPLACADSSGPSAGRAPLRRLTRLEYDNTVRDLLGDDSAPAQAFVPDEAVAGFDANSVATVSKQQTEDYLDAAAKLAETAVGSGLVGCDIASDACARSFVSSFGRRAFRRPLSSDEQNDFFELYAASRAAWGAQKAIALVIEAFLSAPSFLYLVETTVPDAGGVQVARVDAHTLATRLSYFFWSTMPDDALLAAADAGELETLEQIDAQARRLLADPRAEATVASFHAQWLGVANLSEATKDPSLFPEYDAALAASMQEETRRFTAHVVLEGDARLSTLLTSNRSFVDAPLAKLYGAQPPASPFAETELDPEQRAGLLTHASVMTAHSGASDTSWVHRGKLVRERFLCDTLGTPPPGAEGTDPKNAGRLTDPQCKGCHLKMDPIGFGFDALSPIGAHRTVDEHGQPVSTAGEIVALDRDVDVAGEFDGAVELAHRLAASEDVGRCVAVQWFRYATRRQETDQDACSVAVVQDEFAASGHDVRELLIAIAKTDAFRHRAVKK